jgi:lysozyme family protein
MTNLGVTKAVYETWIGHPVSEQIMRKLTPQLVTPLYKKKYWDVVRGDELPIGLDLCVFDFAVNAGPARAARYLQRMIGANADGVLGPQTMSVLNQYMASKKELYAVLYYQDMRRDYYKALPAYGTFGRGWDRRVNEVENTATKMAKKYRHEL